MGRMFIWWSMAWFFVFLSYKSYKNNNTHMKTTWNFVAIILYTNKNQLKYGHCLTNRPRLIIQVNLSELKNIYFSLLKITIKIWYVIKMLTFWLDYIYSMIIKIKKVELINSDIRKMKWKIIRSKHIFY